MAFHLISFLMSRMFWPRLLSDNGPSYIAKDLAKWLDDNGMRHSRGKPYHPQTQGKIERWHLSLKSRILLENYYLPGELEQAVATFVDHYNHRRYHESLDNLTPADVYSKRGNAYLGKSQYDRTIADYSEAIENDPKNAYSYNLRGLASRLKGEIDPAIADFDQAIELNPKYTNAYYNRARAYSDRNQYDRVIADLDKAIALDPNNDGAYNNRGAAYQDNGDQESAISNYREALKINPANEDAKLNLKRLGVTP